MQNQKLLSNEAVGGLLLLACAILALIINNSPLSSLYNHFLDINISIKINGTGLDKPILLWINDGLMAVFFLLIGLELKREIIEGELSNFKKIILPMGGAFGGMVFPVLIYCFFNINNTTYLSGWAVPMATDIAFALGILALFGSRVPIALKLFLLTLAIIDDLGAIVVIGLFHTENISWQIFIYAIGLIAVLITLNIFNVKRTSIYLCIGALLWLCTLQSGFHATIAGVIIAFTIPNKTKSGVSVLHVLESDIRVLVSFFILPVFAFANSGIPLKDMMLTDIIHPIVLGTSIGLIIGNVVGILLITTLIKKVLNIVTTYTYSQLIGVSFLCGIGFTMSLFISGLSFANNIELLNLSRLGILSGSLISTIFGVIILYFTLPKSAS